MTARQGSWRRSTIRPDAGRRVVLLPHAGGTASIFRSWAEEFGSDVDVVVAQYPGREDRLGTETVTRMEQLVAVLRAELLPLLDRPTVLFGHSMGALVAYELARTLGAVTSTPVLLAVSGAPAPGTAASRDVHLRDDAGVMAEIERLGGPTEALRSSDELRDIAMPSIRGDFELVAHYRPRRHPRLGCAITTMTGRDDVDVPPERMAEWASLTDGPCTSHVLDGGHFAILRPGDRRVAVAAIRELMSVSGERRRP